MHSNDWLIVCWAISTLFELRARRWIDAGWSACFAVFLTFDRLLPASGPWQLKYAFLLMGVVLIGYQIAKHYSRYKKGVAVR